MGVGVDGAGGAIIYEPQALVRLRDEAGRAYGEVWEGMYSKEGQDNNVACFYLLGHFAVDKCCVGVHGWVATIHDGFVDVGWSVSGHGADGCTMRGEEMHLIPAADTLAKARKSDTGTLTRQVRQQLT
eukprot:709560-Ditylum_brightwellii.AAC.1